MGNNVQITLTLLCLVCASSAFGGEKRFIEGRVVDKHGEGVAASVYLEAIDPQDIKKLHSSGQRLGDARVVIGQKLKQFAPRILTVQAGTRVRFLNEDRFFHNVFSVSKGNAFDLGLFKHGEKYDELSHTRLDKQAPGIDEVKFKNPERVNVFCNIHPSMSALVVVVDHPYFSTSDTDGNFKILVPPVSGKFQIHALSETGAETSINLDAGRKSPVLLTVESKSIEVPSHPNKLGKPYDPNADLSNW